MVSMQHSKQQWALKSTNFIQRKSLTDLILSCFNAKLLKEGELCPLRQIPNDNVKTQNSVTDFNCRKNSYNIHCANTNELVAYDDRKKLNQNSPEFHLLMAKCLQGTLAHHHYHDLHHNKQINVTSRTHYSVYSAWTDTCLTISFPG